MSKKVVINGCYGGFWLSFEGLLRYAEITGQPCYLFRKGDWDSPPQSWKQIGFEEAGNGIRVVALRVPDPALLPDQTNWREMSQEERVESNKKCSEMTWDIRGFDRDDPALVQVVEELGDRANGSAASLKVVEIPDDVEWYIEEYDGSEWVSEAHRTWG